MKKYINTYFGPAALIAGAFAAVSSTARAEDGADLVKDLHAVFGDHHARAVHAKGIILEGKFVPSKEASVLSKAGVFTQGTIPVTVRFSDFTGIPTIPDNIGEANPRGMAIRFSPAAGDELDLVTHSFNGFPTATADEFGALLRSLSESGADAKKPTALDKFLASHPIAKAFLTSQKTPESFATTPYFGVNSFAFVDKHGKKTFVRYRLVPAAGEHYLGADALKAKGPNFLQEEIVARVNNGPVRFDLDAQLAEPSDKVEDPSVAWPSSRKLVKLGTITVEHLPPDQAAIDKQLLFMPGSPPEGIQTADPMLEMRDQAYPVSFGERQ